MTDTGMLATTLVRVVKLGGRAQEVPAVLDALVAAWRDAPRALCIVHGGGDEVSALQRAMGVVPRFVDGRRVTSEADVALLRMALSGASNKRLVSALLSRGAPALGVSGEDAALLSARRVGGELGFVGEPARVRADVLRHLLAGDLLPVVSPVSGDIAGTGALNVNGDDAAAAVAIALGADELLFVSDVAGVSLDGREAGRIAVEDIGAVLARADVSGGMLAKLEAARAAVLGGVGRVRIGDLGLLGGEGGTVIERHRSAA